MSITIEMSVDENIDKMSILINISRKIIEIKKIHKNCLINT